MAAYREVVGGSLQRVQERGGSLIMLFAVTGFAAAAVWRIAATSMPELVPAVQLGAGLVGAGAAVIALNILVDGGSLRERTTLYDTSYHGLVWTGINLAVGLLLYGAVVGGAAAPLLLLLFAPGIVSVQSIIVSAPPAVAAFLVGVVAVLGAVTGFVAAAFMLFPVFVTVENRNVLTAFRDSLHAVHGHYPVVVVSLLGAAFSFLLPVYAGRVYAPYVAAEVAAVLEVELAVSLAGDAVVVVFAATGAVTGLSILAQVYESVRD